jgi:hypothetical protein
MSDNAGVDAVQTSIRFTSQQWQHFLQAKRNNQVAVLKEVLSQKDDHIAQLAAENVFSDTVAHRYVAGSADYENALAIFHETGVKYQVLDDKKTGDVMVVFAKTDEEKLERAITKEMRQNVVEADAVHEITDDDGTVRTYQGELLQSVGDKPAVIYPDGTKAWYDKGELHRGDGKPALINPDGCEHYFEHGKEREAPNAKQAWEETKARAKASAEHKTAAAGKQIETHSIGR